MDTFTPGSNSKRGIQQTLPTTGTKQLSCLLGNSSLSLMLLSPLLHLGHLVLLSLGLLSLNRPKAHPVWLLGKPMLRLMLLSPLLHLRHLVKLSHLVLLSLGRPGAHPVWLLGKPMLRL